LAIFILFQANRAGTQRLCATEINLESAMKFGKLLKNLNSQAA
jgi:hypothetical protein